MQPNDSFHPLFKAIAVIFAIFFAIICFPFAVLILLALLPYLIAGVVFAVVLMFIFYLFREIAR